jgi:GNAT superfamily N-acetyltransferase
MTRTDVDVEVTQATLTDGESVELVTHDEFGHVTITAWDAGGALVGVAWFRTSTTDGRHPAEASIEVTPGHRRRGLGTALLRRLLVEAAARHIGWLTWTEQADDLVSSRLVKASDAICARRVDHGRATSAILVRAA